MPLPYNLPGPDNDLNAKVDHYIQRALADEDALLYPFDERWGPEQGEKDKIFRFLPGNRIHDIHMNQGNVGSFVGDDGVYQDGAVLIHFPGQDQWVGVFLKFQSQAWHTDDKTGHTTLVVVSGPPSNRERILSPFVPGGLPTPETPDGAVRIVAALVNSMQSPENEFVTLLNTTSQPVSLKDWQIADCDKKKMVLSGTLNAGDTVRVRLESPVAFSSRGGLITLLNADGLRVDGVSYTASQASQPGVTIKF